MLKLLLPVRVMACCWAAVLTLGIESYENPVEDGDVNTMPSTPWLMIRASASETVVLGRRPGPIVPCSNLEAPELKPPALKPKTPTDPATLNPGKNDPKPEVILLLLLL